MVASPFPNDLSGTATPSHGWFNHWVYHMSSKIIINNNHNISMYCVVRISVCACSYIVHIFCHSLAPSLPGPRTNTWSRPGRCSASPDKRILPGDSYAPVSFGDIHDMPIYNAVIYIYIIIYYIIYIYLIYLYIYNQETCEISGIRGQWLQGTCSHDVFLGEFQ